MKRTVLLALSVLAASAGLTAQETKGALMPVNDAVFKYTDATHALYSRTYTVVIPDKESDGYAVFSCNVNNGSTKLKSFSGEVREASGKPKKIKKSDLKYTEYSEGLADSYGTYYYSPTIVSYPATVTYSYEIAYSDAVLSFTPFDPLPFDGGIVLGKATYTLEVPSDDCFTYRTLNMPDCKPERTAVPGGISYKWTVEGISPLAGEPYSPQAANRVKMVLFTPSDFSYEGRKGSGRNWKDIGNWLASLMPDDPELPAELKARLESITAGCATDREKIARIHDYLGETTRYVSIQLGLGGLKPLDPAYVFKNKFGDCKALSAYLKAMLAYCGIPSDYVIINMGADRMIPDFPSLATTNHAILCIPQQGDTLWVECTNPEIPLGYVHGQIAGNRALVVRKDGSYVTTLPKAADESNSDRLYADVVLNPDGSGQATVTQTVRGRGWESFHTLTKLTSDRQADAVKGDFTLPMVSITDLEIKDFPEEYPYCQISFKASASPYASKTGNRLFLTANPFRDYPDNTSRTRSNDLYFKTGWADSDTITVRIPDGYSIETAPGDISFENKFGSVGFSMDKGQGTVTLRFNIVQHSGSFPKEDYGEYRTFRKNLAKVCSGKIVLVRDK